MSRVDPQHAKTHPEDAHYLLAPGDLPSHIEEHHYPYPSEIMADWYFPEKVNAFLAERGIPQATEGTDDMEPWEVDGLLAWHEQAHDALGFSDEEDPDQPHADAKAADYRAALTGPAGMPRELPPVPACPSCGGQRWKVDDDVTVRAAVIVGTP